MGVNSSNMFRSVVSTSSASFRSLNRCIIRCNAWAYEPYAGVQLESIFSPPALGELPEEYQKNTVPKDFTLLNFKDLGMGSIMCAPNKWHLSSALDPCPDQMLHTDYASRFAISKEDVLNKEEIQSGVIIRSFKHLLGAPHNLIENLEENLFGKARWHYQHCTKKGVPLDKELLQDGYGIGHIFTGAMDLGNVYRNVVELNYFQRSTDDSDPSIPLRDYYAYTDIFYWKKERWVMVMTYQCPLEEVEQTKPILDTIRNHSIFNYSSPIFRIVYPKLFSVSPYPSVQ